MEKSNLRPWVDITEAAEILGVHITTLRRWADNGKIACVRTPGGRRRFSRESLEQFLVGMQKPAPAAPPTVAARTGDSDVRLQISQHAMRQEHWMGRLDEIQRMRFKHTGQLMLGLMMQYNSRLEGGEVFLHEAERISHDYGHTCYLAGMSIKDTVRAFLFFRHSIIDMIFDTNTLNSPYDESGKRLYNRTNTFFDTLLLAVLEGFSQAATPSTSQG
jgi:excisionase family DNA binding protein